MLNILSRRALPAGRLAALGAAPGLSPRAVKPRVEAPIIDRTGLEGAFDLEMEFERDLFAQNSPLPNIFTAMREQLGLRLQSETAPVVVLVVEGVHRPTPN